MNIGDYVRTKSGSIFKIIGGNVDNWDLDVSFGYLETFEEEWLELYRYNDNCGFFNDKNIIKSSPNIIDLIEVGDYVNGKKVEWVGYGMYKDTEDGLIGIGDKFILFNEFTKDGTREKDIKSILTKEQFSQMEYKL